MRRPTLQSRYGLHLQHSNLELGQQNRQHCKCIWNTEIVKFHAASVVSHKYGYEDARGFWLSARRDDEQWRAPREEEQRSRRPKGPADS